MELTPEFWAVISTALAVIIVPAVVSFLKKSVWPHWGKLILAFGISFVGAVAAEFATGALTEFKVEELLAHATIIFTGAHMLYKIWFGNSKLDDKLTALGPN